MRTLSAGGDDGNRTHDPLLAGQVLSQLSYTPKFNVIREEVEKIATPEGGLCMIYGLYPGVPLENAKAVMDAMEKYSTYFS